MAGSLSGWCGGWHTVRSLMSRALKMMISNTSATGATGRAASRASVPNERTAAGEIRGEGMPHLSAARWSTRPRPRRTAGPRSECPTWRSATRRCPGTATSASHCDSAAADVRNAVGELTLARDCMAIVDVRLRLRAMRRRADDCSHNFCEFSRHDDSGQVTVCAPSTLHA